MADKTSVVRGGKPIMVKVRNVTRSMTTATCVATLPKGSRVLPFVLGGTASNAGTTATLSIGTTTTATELVNAVSVLSGGSGNGVNHLIGVAGAIPTVLTADTPIYVKYAETGTASSAGAWTLLIQYTTGNITDDDTV